MTIPSRGVSLMGDIQPAKMADALFASAVNALVAQIPCA